MAHINITAKERIPAESLVYLEETDDGVVARPFVKHAPLNTPSTIGEMVDDLIRRYPAEAEKFRLDNAKWFGGTE